MGEKEKEEEGTGGKKRKLIFIIQGTQKVKPLQNKLAFVLKKNLFRNK